MALVRAWVEVGGGRVTTGASVAEGSGGPAATVHRQQFSPILK